MDTASKTDTPAALENTTTPTTDLSSARGTTQIIYILYGVSILVGITALVAIVMNYLSKDAVRGTWLESHYKWQMRTFWFGLLWMAVAFITIWIGVGILMLPIATIWYIYRIVRGWLQMRQGKPMYTF